MILGQNQLYVVKEYIEYYNSKRPHQGIDQRVPNGTYVKELKKIEK